MVKLLKFGKKGIITFLVAALVMVFASGAMAAPVITSADLKAKLEAGGNVELGGNIDDAGMYTISKDTTIDLAGHTITSDQNPLFNVKDGATLTINDSAANGKLISTNNAGMGIKIYGNQTPGENRTAVNSKVILNAGTIEAKWYPVTVFGKGAQFDINGGVVKATESDGYGISGNGTVDTDKDYGGTVININGGEVIGGTGVDPRDDNVAAAGIYHPQSGIVNMKGGTVSGYMGIQFKSGTLNMTGGTITANGDMPSPVPSYNGATCVGAALAFIASGYPGGDMNANISGTAELKSTGANTYAIYEAEIAAAKEGGILKSLNISGGMFSGTAGALSIEDKTKTLTYAITGGTYSSDPSDYVESPYVVKQVEGKYVVALAGVAVTPTAAELVLGLTPTAKLTASSDIEEAFTWASKNNDVVTVDSSGNITAVGAGTADVTATGAIGKSVGTCVVTVRAAAPVSVTPSKMELNIGATGKATAKYDAKDSITWKSSDTAVATVKDGTVTAVKAGIAVITAKGSKTSAACTVTVTDPASPDPVTPTPAPVDAGTVDKENNPVNKEEGKPENVEAATPAITEATEEGKAAVVSATKIEEKNLVATADGKLTISPVLAKSALEEVISADATVAPKNVVLLPIVQAAVTANNVAALAFTMTGEQLGAEENTVAGDVKVIKVLADGKGGQFSYASAAADYADKTFTLKDADGKSLALTDKVAKASTYTLVVFVADNGDFDLDATAGSVIDPVAVATNAATEPKSGGSSSGCNGGFGALALFGFALVPMFYGKKR